MTGNLAGAGNKIGSIRKQNELGFCTSPERINNKYDNGGGPSRFFYCAKASSSERNKGLDKPCSHPTVKPLSLMKYIITLLAPPNNPTCLDPFAGSGSTLIAAKELGISCIGIEKEEEYVTIARKRLENWQVKEENNQMEMFKCNV
jgi:DNA modification methylase